MYDYNICNQADAKLFERQCHALESHIPDLRASTLLEDVDGTLIQTYHHRNGVIKVKNDMQVDALYVISDFDLLPYFK